LFLELSKRSLRKGQKKKYQTSETSRE